MLAERPPSGRLDRQDPSLLARGGAASPEAEWLVFIDADMRAEPTLIASAVAEAEAGSTFFPSLRGTVS